MSKPMRLKIVSMFPLKNEIELVNLETGLTVYWKLGPALSCRMYRIGEIYLVKDREISREPESNDEP